MAEENRCPQCGDKLGANAPRGVCPKCLIKLGLPSGADADKAGPSDNQSGVPTSATPPGGFVPPEPAELAKQFPQLEILELLGQGGMGAVYKARQKQLDRLVALKILPTEVGQDATFTERFMREARSLAKLNHPRIVSVFDFGQTKDGLCYFIMEYVEGTDLRHVIEGGKLEPAEALAIVPQVCEALQFAHEEGIVHRDIKPENILLDKKGRVKIADFGLAKLLDKPATAFTLTQAGQRMGTPHYMAPEQIEHPGQVDHRADIYSLGVVFYEMLTGELPIGRFAAPSQKVQVDVRLDKVVLRSLEKEPERRYQHATEVKTDVEAISSGKELAEPTPAHVKKTLWSRQSPLKRRIIVAVLLLAVAGVVTYLVHWQMTKQKYPYSQFENEVFDEMDRLSREMPSEFVENHGNRNLRYQDTEDVMVNGGKLRYIMCNPGSFGPIIVNVMIMNVDDYIVKRVKKHKEGKPYKGDMYTETYERRPDLITTFNAWRPTYHSYESDETENSTYYTLMKGRSLVSYVKKRGYDFWIRYEGNMFGKGASMSKIDQFLEGETVPVEQVQRYIDLTDRFDETYSFRKGHYLAAFEGMIRRSFGKINIQSMLEKDPKLVIGENSKGQTPLHLAVVEGNKDVCEILIAKGADVNAKTEDGCTPLYYAAVYGNEEIIKLLREHGGNMGFEIFDAVVQGEIDKVKSVLAKNPDLVDFKDTWVEMSPLSWAAMKGHENIAELLIKNGADINAQNKDGDTPLHLAVYYNKENIAKFLILNEADVNAKSDGILTPMYYAIANGNEELVKFLREHGGNMGFEILDAVVQGEIDKVESLLAENPELVNFKDSSWNWTPLFWAACTGEKEVAELLINMGAQVNAKADKGHTALYYAEKQGHKEVANLLCKHGAKE